MKTNYSVKAILRTDKILISGECPICIQIIINSEKKRISIGESIDPAHWDKRAGLANKKGYAILNSLINKRKSDIEAFCNQTILAGMPLSFTLIDNFIKGTQNKNFYNIFDEVIEGKLSKICEDTAYKYKTLRIRLKGFKAKIFVSDIDTVFITKFDSYLKDLGSIAKVGGYVKSLVNLNRKKVLSFTPRSCSLKLFILALKDSAAALVLL